MTPQHDRLDIYCGSDSRYHVRVYGRPLDRRKPDGSRVARTFRSREAAAKAAQVELDALAHFGRL